jgi:hypothetical protein
MPEANCGPVGRPFTLNSAWGRAALHIAVVLGDTALARMRADAGRDVNHVTVPVEYRCTSRMIRV